ncbi:hypothetical protein DRH27_04560 [Candidatus Falkowbacteria bacterium]|nr:MAG: hypothetical protein DRH27_04560 [Candidatus Falkowbacteria bacterium]
MASSVLVHFRQNLITKFLYVGSGLWFGLLINLLLAIGIFWLVLLILKIFKINTNIYWLGYLAIIGAVLYLGFGIYNVYTPRVNNIIVKIKDLPEEWQGKTIVQLSDVHLGIVLEKNFLNSVVSKTNNLKPEIIAITGDLFDGMDGNLEEFIGPLNNLKAEKGVYYVTGNHETYLSTTEVFNILDQTKINVLKDEIVNINGLQVIGISYPELNENKDTKKIIENNKNFSLEEPSILLYHSPTGIFSENNSHNDIYFSLNRDFNTVQELGIDFQLSGHTHRGQIFPFNFITKLIYGQYDYGLHYINDFAIYTSSGVGVWGPTMRTGSRSEIVAITLEKK